MNEKLKPPEGWKLVPVEPTREMWAAMADTLYGYKNRHHDKVAGDLYHAMLAAAPALTSPQGEETPAAPSPQADLVRYMHRKGGAYEVLGIGKMQSEMWEERGEGTIDRPSPVEPVDMREVVVYRSEKDGSLWVRPREEFEDGRFTILAATEGSADA